MVGNWRPRKLDELGYVARGRSRHRPRNDPSLYGGEYPFIQTGEIKAAGLYLREHTESYNEAGLAQSKLWPLETLCLTIAANIAETTILGIPACFPDSVVGFIADECEADVRFVKYCVDTLRIRMQAISSGTTQDNLSLDKLLTFDFIVPDATTQRRIAEVLVSYDDLIENNTRRIGILKEIIRSTYREWFVEYRFPGHAEGGLTDSVIGMIPAGWRVGYLSEPHPFALCKPKVDPYDGTKTYLATADCTDVHDLEQGIDVEYEELPSRAQHVPLPGSVWFGRMAGYRKILLFPDASVETESLVLSSGFACLKCDPDWFAYVAATVLDSEFEIRKRQHATGGVQVSLTDGGAKDMPWLIPTEEVVQQFSGVISPMLELLVTLRRENVLLTMTRDALLPKLLSGDIEVTDGDLRDRP